MKVHPTLFDPESPGTLTLTEATTFSDHGIVSRALLSTPACRVTLFGFAAGQELTEHASPSRALIQILTGASEWIVEGRAQVVKAGEVLHLPPGARHSVRAIEPFSMLLHLIRESPKVTNPCAGSLP